MFSYIKKTSEVGIKASQALFQLLLLICVVQVTLTNAVAQLSTPVGTWRTHFNYKKAKTLAQAGNLIYCATEQGLFYYDKSANEANILTKLDGLSNNQIAQIKIHTSLKLLIVGYASGTLDLIQLDNQFEPTSQITTLKFIEGNTAILSSKKVSDINFYQNIAFMSYDFGLVVLDLDKKEVKETYLYLGENGNALGVSQSVVVGNILYISTPIGIRQATLSNEVNLQYFGNWSTLKSPSGTALRGALSVIGTQLWIGSTEGDLWKYTNGQLLSTLKFATGIDKLIALDTQHLLIKNGTILRVYQTSDESVSRLTEPLALQLQDGFWDSQQKFWIADNANGLVSNASGTYKSYSPTSQDTLFQYRKDSIILDSDKNRWTRLGAYQGIMVETPAKQRTYLYNGKGQGNLSSATVASMTLDKYGQIWVGTTAGVAVFDDPASVVSGRNLDAYTPIFEKRRLLANETVTTIAIDGGNRKWMGTSNGVFLFSEDGTELVNNFTVANSPLPSNQISYIGIEPSTGEVFIRTSQGMVSYQGTAMEAGDNISGKALIYPNPVRPEYEGLITIDGLYENVVVKITDVAGRLIYETKSNGSRAVWNGQYPTGGKVSTGIYYVMTSTDEGNQALMGKIAVVR
ncbi:T9SS type A sorting domain-containing protein [Flectobacillus sp. DC10W]|uniref:T9SS type A sorting domain-containing protein n=1 Tax=Flectobacillus longus TaxID=2984207 RepID=A0ABT6YN97_9BACT|nr:T9SS type A sorting domain-containing protein [Flectobacillus longus]MDI9865082.1 T9SS type A sorting domain-containing protein [Flectobacillus longus]